MKTFEQALEEAAICRAKRQCATGNDGFNTAQEFLLKVGFEDGVYWLIDNLHLLPAKDLLKHEDVSSLVSAAKITTIISLREVDDARNVLLETLKPFTEGEK